MRSAVPDTVTTAEAAALAGISLREVNRVFDEGILPEPLVEDDAGRRIARAAVPLLAFYFGTAGLLEASARRSVILSIVKGRAGISIGRLTALRRGPRSVCLGGGVSVSIGQFIADTDSRTAQLARAREMVVADPGVLGGMPAIRGTRIPVHDIAASVAAGLPRARIQAAYPGLDDNAIDLAVLYAQAQPARGRPVNRGEPDRPAALRLRSSKRGPRHALAAADLPAH